MADLSIIVPFKDEADSLPILAAEIAAALEGRAWECLWIDDGSSDAGPARLAEIAAADPRHRLIRLDRNYGQSGALLVGFRHATGALVATLDADLQNDPADLPRLLAELETAGVDMVNGRRRRRRDGFVRRLSSRVANGVRTGLTGRTVSDVGCSLRVMRRVCVQDLPRFHGMHRFLPTLAAMRGCTMTEIDVNHRPRRHGETKYGVGNRLWVGLYDCFGVLWLKRRAVFAQERSDSEEGRR